MVRLDSRARRSIGAVGRSVSVVMGKLRVWTFANSNFDIAFICIFTAWGGRVGQKAPRRAINMNNFRTFASKA